MTDWRDLLAEQVRGLEAKAGCADPLLAKKALAMLRVIRGYETRVRHLTLRLDSSCSSPPKAAPQPLGSPPSPVGLVGHIVGQNQKSPAVR